ncbi:MAG: hypothetical protein CL760_08105 [Chloroflexi bacterium]|nr:hypothetical protein [Chloroflexota bacterium]MQG05298.1 DNA translocase FtsK [SAR202 cluster bacterium]
MKHKSKIFISTVCTLLFVILFSLIIYYQDALYNTLSSWQKFLTEYFGIGVSIVILWFSFFIGVIVSKRTWFRKTSYWIASFPFLFFLLASSTYLDDVFHLIEKLKLYDYFVADISMGGIVGRQLVGNTNNSTIFPIIRIIGLGLCMVVIIFPRDSVRLVTKGTRVLMYLLLAFIKFVRDRKQIKSTDNMISGTENSKPVRIKLSQQENINQLDDFAEINEGIISKNTSSSTEPNNLKQTKLDINLNKDLNLKKDNLYSGEIPSTDILETIVEKGISEKEIEETSKKIKTTLADFGIDIEIGEVQSGPTVTMYGIIPGWIIRQKKVPSLDSNGKPILDDNGKKVFHMIEEKTRVKVDNIISREKDLALALKTPNIRLETPVMGKSLLGLEVPNSTSSIVSMKSMIECFAFQKVYNQQLGLPIVLGKNNSGEAEVMDLTKMPHLLIAGSTGSGKSVFINAVICCLLMSMSPEKLKLILIDPKRVELTPYSGVPHLVVPPVVETEKVVTVLKSVINEMLDRYRRMQEVQTKNIEAYNKKTGENMPYLVVAVDELADLMMTASFDVEQSICRLAQLGRATGIHLIVATQRPSVDVVTGLIKANFPTRASFGVTSHIDSRTILDTTGAEKLLGKGDMLYLGVDDSRPTRIQAVYVSDDEINEIVKFWENTQISEDGFSLQLLPDDSNSTEIEGSNLIDGMSEDSLIEKAIIISRTDKRISTSLLQRKLRIGYPRAARLMDQLEEKGIIGPSDGVKSREVLL